MDCPGALCILLISGCGISREEYEAAVDDAYDEGYHAGYEEGAGDVEYARSEAFNEGVHSGYGSGYDEGYRDGLSEAQDGEDTVYITRTGSKYHSSRCAYLEGSRIRTARTEAIEDGYSACSRCNP